jgi:hypothetical protein
MFTFAWEEMEKGNKQKESNLYDPQNNKLFCCVSTFGR